MRRAPLVGRNGYTSEGPASEGGIKKGRKKKESKEGEKENQRGRKKKKDKEEEEPVRPSKLPLELFRLLKPYQLTLRLSLIRTNLY